MRVEPPKPLVNMLCKQDAGSNLMVGPVSRRGIVLGPLVGRGLPKSAKETSELWSADRLAGPEPHCRPAPHGRTTVRSYAFGVDEPPRNCRM